MDKTLVDLLIDGDLQLIEGVTGEISARIIDAIRAGKIRYVAIVESEDE